MSGRKRVFFIGIDSAEPEVMRKWMDSGDLPVLASLRDRGASGATTAPKGFGNGVVWPSFFTAVHPAKHGRYYYKQLHPGSYETYLFREDSDFRREPIWASLSRAGRRVAVIDMVRAPLVRDLEGIQLADWMTHDRTGPTRSWPEELAAEVLERFGDDPLGGRSDVSDRGAGDWAKLRDQILARIETKTQMSRHYWGAGDWDLFMTVYADPHDIGHQCWHLHDPNHPQHDPALAAALGDPIKSVYVAADAAVGRLLEGIPAETTVVVFTGPGMGPDHTGNFVMDEILRRLEGAAESRGASLWERARAATRRTLPAPLRKRVRPLTRPNEETLLAAERSRRKCFAVPHNSSSGAIRINLVGREPNGRIRPGREFEAFCKTLTEDLMALRNLETGEPIVEEVVRAAACEGDQRDALPDLLVVWSRPARIRALGSAKVGEIRQPFIGNRTGDHTPRGLFWASGPDVTPGELRRPISVMDLGASIAGLLGVALPDADGQMIPELRPRSPG